MRKTSKRERSKNKNDSEFKDKKARKEDRRLPMITLPEFFDETESLNELERDTTSLGSPSQRYDDNDELFGLTSLSDIIQSSSKQPSDPEADTKIEVKNDSYSLSHTSPSLPFSALPKITSSDTMFLGDAKIDQIQSDEVDMKSYAAEIEPFLPKIWQMDQSYQNIIWENGDNINEIEIKTESGSIFSKPTKMDNNIRFLLLMAAGSWQQAKELFSTVKEIKLNAENPGDTGENIFHFAADTLIARTEGEDDFEAELKALKWLVEEAIKQRVAIKINYDRYVSPLHLIAYYPENQHSLWLLKKLLTITKQEDLNVYDVYGKTPLLEAIESGNTEVALILLKQPKVDINLFKLVPILRCPGKFAPGASVFDAAKQLKRTAVLKQIAQREDYDSKVLYVDIRRERLEFMSYAFAAQGNPDSLKVLFRQYGHYMLLRADSSGWTMLHVACHTNNLRVIAFLLNKKELDNTFGQNKLEENEYINFVNRKTYNHSSALGVNLLYGKLVEKQIELFLKCPQFEINSVQDLTNRTLLHIAISNNWLHVIQLMVKTCGPRIDFMKRDGHGNTPLRLACIEKQHEIITFFAQLNKKGFGINPNDYGHKMKIAKKLSLFTEEGWLGETTQFIKNVGDEDERNTELSVEDLLQVYESQNSLKGVITYEKTMFDFHINFITPASKSLKKRLKRHIKYFIHRDWNIPDNQCADRPKWVNTNLLKALGSLIDKEKSQEEEEEDDKISLVIDYKGIKISIKADGLHRMAVTEPGTISYDFLKSCSFIPELKNSTEVSEDRSIQKPYKPLLELAAKDKDLATFTALLEFPDLVPMRSIGGKRKIDTLIANSPEMQRLLEQAEKKQLPAHLSISSSSSSTSSKSITYYDDMRGRSSALKHVESLSTSSSEVAELDRELTIEEFNELSETGSINPSRLCTAQDGLDPKSGDCKSNSEPEPYINSAVKKQLSQVVKTEFKSYPSIHEIPIEDLNKNASSKNSSFMRKELENKLANLSDPDSFNYRCRLDTEAKIETEIQHRQAGLEVKEEDLSNYLPCSRDNFENRHQGLDVYFLTLLGREVAKEANKCRRIDSGLKLVRDSLDNIIKSEKPIDTLKSLLLSENQIDALTFLSNRSIFDNLNGLLTAKPDKLEKQRRNIIKRACDDWDRLYKSIKLDTDVNLTFFISEDMIHVQASGSYNQNSLKGLFVVTLHKMMSEIAVGINQSHCYSRFLMVPINPKSSEKNYNWIDNVQKKVKKKHGIECLRICAEQVGLYKAYKLYTLFRRKDQEVDLLPYENVNYMVSINYDDDSKYYTFSIKEVASCDVSCQRHKDQINKYYRACVIKTIKSHAKNDALKENEMIQLAAGSSRLTSLISDTYSELSSSSHEDSTFNMIKDHKQQYAVKKTSSKNTTESLKKADYASYDYLMNKKATLQSTPKRKKSEPLLEVVTVSSQHQPITSASSSSSSLSSAMTFFSPTAGIAKPKKESKALTEIKNTGKLITPLIPDNSKVTEDKKQSLSGSSNNNSPSLSSQSSPSKASSVNDKSSSSVEIRSKLNKGKLDSSSSSSLYKDTLSKEKVRKLKSNQNQLQDLDLAAVWTPAHLPPSVKRSTEEKEIKLHQDLFHTYGTTSPSSSNYLLLGCRDNQSIGISPASNGYTIFNAQLTSTLSINSELNDSSFLPHSNDKNPWWGKLLLGAGGSAGELLAGDLMFQAIMKEIVRFRAQDNELILTPYASAPARILAFNSGQEVYQSLGINIYDPYAGRSGVDNISFFQLSDDDDQDYDADVIDGMPGRDGEVNLLETRLYKEWVEYKSHARKLFDAHINFEELFVMYQERVKLPSSLGGHGDKRGKEQTGDQRGGGAANDAHGINQGSQWTQRRDKCLAKVNLKRKGDYAKLYKDICQAEKLSSSNSKIKSNRNMRHTKEEELAAQQAKAAKKVENQKLKNLQYKQKTEKENDFTQRWNKK